jgi:signal transduction histidine kinase/ActR/RegA family two-component response regulator
LGHQYRDAGGRWIWEDVPNELSKAVGAVFALRLEETSDSRVLWLGGTAGILRWDVAAEPRGATPPALQVHVRRVAQPGATEVVSFSGNRDPGEPLKFQHTNRALRFEFASPAFGRGVRPKFRTLLDGFDDDWTPWSTDTSREFTNIPAGRFRFRVQARNALGQEGEAAAFAFRVLPPWYQTWWSYAGYVLLGLLAVAGIVRWRLGALRRRNEQLEQIVAERTAELRVARDDADRANRAKSSFLANMSHELRTPLNGILGYTQILRRDAEMSARNRQRLGVLETSGEHLLRLINEVLDLAKIEAGRLELRPVACDLRTLVYGVGETFRPRIEEKGLGFATTIDGAVPARVMIDEQKFGQVLFNLLGNAVKFTRAGRIDLRVRALSESRAGAPGGPQERVRLRVEIEDTGAGIPKEQQAAIFEPFRQVEGSDAVKEGTGLGLTICSRIVALMGGALGVESEVGRGSRFWFEIEVPAAGGEGAMAGAATSVSGYTGARRRVLVVDDVPVNREVVREMLEPLGFEVDAAADGPAALASVERARPDLVLMDLRMEPMSGAEVVQRLRAVEAWRGLRIVSFSASALGFTRDDAVRIGCDDHLPKPFREAELLGLLERQLALEWIRGANATPVAAPGVDVPQPDRAQAAELLGFARRGDANGLRQALARLRVTVPQLAAFAEEMESLVARYRMHDIRQRLEALAAEP